MQADAEHEQYDAHLRQLTRKIAIGNETGREMADNDARHKISDKRRQADAIRDIAEHR